MRTGETTNIPGKALAAKLVILPELGPSLTEKQETGMTMISMRKKMGMATKREVRKKNGRFNKSEEELKKPTLEVLQLCLRYLKLPVYGIKAKLID